MKHLFSLVLLASLVCLEVHAQSLSINTDGSAANASAILDVKSTTQGMLIPRMTAAQRTAITGVAGLLVYQTDAPAGFYFHNGSVWVSLNATTDAAALTSGTLPAARMPALTGDVTSAANSTATTIANNAVTNVKVNDVAISKLTGTVGVKYYMVVAGVFPAAGGCDGGCLGSIVIRPSNTNYVGMLRPCDGQLLTIAGNSALYDIIGTTYGGNGTTNFALPNLNNANAMPKGQ